jgi:hypothetical protein
MAVGYRHEYVSGVVTIFDDGAFGFEVEVSNRGHEDGHARAVFVDETGTTRYDSSDMSVGPGRIQFTGFQQGAENFSAGSYVVRIYTTSADLVPSARAYSLGDVDLDQPAVSDFYFAPGDFAQFPLHVMPDIPRPPIGPAEG